MKKYPGPGPALARMRKTHGARPKVMSTCPRCGKVCSARELRGACPAHIPKK